MRSSIDLCNDNEHPETHPSAEHEMTRGGCSKPNTVKPWYSGPWNTGIPWNSRQNCAFSIPLRNPKIFS